MLRDAAAQGNAHEMEPGQTLAQSDGVQLFGQFRRAILVVRQRRSWWPGKL